MSETDPMGAGGTAPSGSESSDFAGRVLSSGRGQTMAEVGDTVLYRNRGYKPGTKSKPAKGVEGEPGFQPAVEGTEVEELLWPAMVTAVHPTAAPPPDAIHSTGAPHPELDLTVFRRTNAIQVEKVAYSDDPTVELAWTYRE